MFLRFCLILIFPIIITYLFFISFSLNSNFDIGSKKITPNQLKENLIEEISKKEQDPKFELMSEIINSKWFLYKMTFKNNMKIAITATEPLYSEHETVLTLKVDNQDIFIPYGEQKIIYFQKSTFISKEFLGYSFFVKPNQEIKSGPNQVVKIEHSPLLGGVDIKITLSYLSIIKIFILSLVFWWGVIILAKQFFQFVYLGKEWWLKRN